MIWTDDRTADPQAWRIQRFCKANVEVQEVEKSTVKKNRQTKKTPRNSLNISTRTLFFYTKDFPFSENCHHHSERWGHAHLVVSRHLNILGSWKKKKKRRRPKCFSTRWRGDKMAIMTIITVNHCRPSNCGFQLLFHMQSGAGEKRRRIWKLLLASKTEDVQNHDI